MSSKIFFALGFIEGSKDKPREQIASGLKIYGLSDKEIQELLKHHREPLKA